MSVPVLYEANATDFFNKGLGTLPDALTAVVTEERNGEFIFEMTYPADGARSGLLENNRIIKVDAGHVLKDQRFVIKKTAPQMSEDGKIYINVYAEHISYITNDLALKPSVAVSGSANDAMQQWQKAIIDSNEITADSDITTSNSTAWTIDKVQTARQALGGVDGSILDVWGGEYLFDNLHISLKKQRGSSASTLLAYGRNIISFQQEENIENTYTSIYPYATLNSASGDTSSLYTIDNYVVDSQYVGNYPNRKILPVDFSSNFENVKVGTKASDASDSDTTVYMTVAEVQSQLKVLAQQYITNNSVGIPTVSISVSFVDLSKTSNYADVAPLEQLDLCDIVPVRFTKLGIDTTAKVTHVEWNVLTDSYDKIELGSITPTLGQTLNTLTTVAQAAKQVAQDAQNNATIAWQSADGKTTTFKGSSSQAFPTAQHIGDLYWRENGDTTEVYIWDGSEWAFQFSNKTGQNISEAVDKAMAEADTATKNANAAVETGNQALTKAQTGIDAANAAADNASTAMSNSSTAINNAKSAMTDAANAINTANNSSDIANAVQQQVTTLKDGSTMTIADLANGLALKLVKSDLNGYATQSWASNQITVTANGLQSQVASVKRTADKATTDITTLNQRADGWDSTISSLSTNKADQTWTTNQIKASADSLNVNISKVQTQVNNSAVGTNLFVGTKDFDNLLSWADYGGWNILTDTYNGLSIIQTDQDWNGLSQYIQVSAGEIYTFSVYARYTSGTGTSTLYAILNRNPENGHTASITTPTQTDVSLTSSWQRVFSTFTITSDGWIKPRIERTNKNTNTLQICGMKLEKGSNATDYSANPADNATVTSVTNLSITLDGIKQTVAKKVDNDTFASYQTQTATLIGSKVASNDFNSYKTQTDNAISQRVTSSAFSSYQTQTDSAIQQRVTSATYNAEVTILSNQIDSKVTAGGDITNICLNPYFDGGSSRGWSAVKVSSGNGRPGVTYYGGQTSRDNLYGDWVNVAPNEVYYFQIFAWQDSSVNDFNFGLQTMTKDGTIGWYSAIHYTPSESGMKSATFTIPSDVVKAQIWTQIGASSNFGTWWFTRVYVGKTAPAGEMYSQIQQLSDNINLRVVKNDVINQINISTEGILIAGKKVHITGQTTIDNAVIKSAMIDSLSADKVTFGTLNGNLVNVTNINADNITAGTLTGVSFHQSSSGHDTWIDGNGVHDYDGAGNNAWIKQGILQVYDNANQGFIMDAGSIKLTSINNYQTNATDMYGSIQRNSNLFDASTYGMDIIGSNGLVMRTNNATGIKLSSSAMLGTSIVGSFIGLSNNGKAVIGLQKDIQIFAGSSYTSVGGLTVKPVFYLGTNAWQGEGVDDGSNAYLAGAGITLDAAGSITLNIGHNKRIYWGTNHQDSTDGHSFFTTNSSGYYFWGGDTSSYQSIHVQSVSQSSLLSLKTNLSKLDPAQALSALIGTDIYNYNYKSDLKNGISKTYATAVIDDVNTKPQYNIPYDFISADGTGRDDGTILGYAVAAIKELNSKISSLEAELKQLKENAA
ncbi:MAG: phage tail spike protein [Liquorilactobacillus nagelii]|uniref:phage tail spike protein n=1 Tax=Liquorilactobacillus nagelii TaxID=82688 RepID=UPI0039EA4E3D